jgi:hypothetical protein
MMMNQYDQLELHTFLEARKLAAEGKEYSHLIPRLGPDKAMRLRVFVQDLPDAIREMTIYGRAVAKTPTKSSKKK